MYKGELGMRQFIIDTDPGIDDAFAIGLMMQSDVKILGITTVSGNNGIDSVTVNALRLVNFFDRPEIKVYEGAGKPIVRESGTSDGCHGTDGMGGTYLPVGHAKVEAQHAVDYLVETIGASDGDIEILALGPLTNLALAIQKAPEAMKKIKMIHSMGGGVNHGNITPFAEFNYWVDPEATQVVFDFGIPIRMVGLNVTEQCIISPEEFELLNEKGDRISELYYKMQQHYSDHYKKRDGIDGAIIHDLLTAATVFDESLVSFETQDVRVETEGDKRGATLIEPGNGKPVLLGMSVDVVKYKSFVFEKMFGIQL
jgi:inosine-uridine nucleoside N-ribohydrolase